MPSTSRRRGRRSTAGQDLDAGAAAVLLHLARADEVDLDFGGAAGVVGLDGAQILQRVAGALLDHLAGS